MTDGAWTSLYGLLTKPKQVPCSPHQLRNCPWSLQHTALYCATGISARFPFFIAEIKAAPYLREAAILPCHGMWSRCPWENKLSRNTPKVPSQSELRRKGGAKNTVILPAWFLTHIPKFHLLKINRLPNCKRNLDAHQYGYSPPNFLTIPLHFFYQHWLWFFILKGKTSKIYMREKSFHILQ